LKYIKRKISKNYNEYAEIIKNIQLPKVQKVTENNGNKIEKTYNCILRSLDDISKKQKCLEEKIFKISKKTEVLGHQVFTNKLKNS
jgi:hypothetical protein